MLRKIWRSLLLSVFCLFILIGCVPSETVATETGRITIGTTATVSTLDPADAYNTFAGNLLYNLGDRLYRYKPGSDELEPQLATALPKVSADRLTYTILLRKGVVFHDGEPFNAKAMEFSLKRFIENGGSPSFLLSDVIESVSAVGDDQLVIKLQKPFAGFPSLLAFSGACAVSPKAYKIGKKEFNSETFVGTGAYKLVKFGTDSIVFDANEQYWGGKPANRGVNVQFFSSAANLFNAFRTGAIDVAGQGLAIEQVRNLRENASDNTWRMLERSGSGIDYLSLNVKSPPLDRLEVRQAIAAMIDRPILESRIFRGQVEPLYSLLPNSLSEQKPVFKELGDRNIDKARNLLTKAGYSESNPLEVELWYRSNISSDGMAAITMRAIVQKYLGNLMKLQLNSVESVTANANVESGAYPMFLWDWSPDFLDADNYIQPFMECSKGSAEKGCEKGSTVVQGSFYYNDQVNQLIDRSRKEQNPETRKQLFEQLQTILVNEVPFIPLWQNKDVLFVQKNIQNATLEVTQKVPFATMKKV
ncbi:extracellular solute-binding protein, family 5 [Leptolyngbya sp. NIES-3755]|nr:extracellular solute-binding protein, family 5 [Leptolyngbya sp. NIES-3755]